jgi:hypothetical protein
VVGLRHVAGWQGFENRKKCNWFGALRQEDSVMRDQLPVASEL